MSIRITKNPLWTQEQKDTVETIERIDKINDVLTAEDSKSLIDAWVDFLDFLPQLWGPNGDSAKKALHGALDNIVNHNNEIEKAYEQAFGKLPENKRGDGQPYNFDPNSSFFIQRVDPLVLDTNDDGTIGTTTVTESETYFDITGDGIKERVGWIKSEDALLVYDKNEDGQIGGVDEVFGNLTTEGFDELRETIDSNYDNKIDKRDILFNRLQVWHDYDADGKVDGGELKTLKEANVTSIDLNSVQTNIPTNGHTITEASHYQTNDGYEKLVADVHLAYDGRITTVDTAQLEDFSIDLDTLTLPRLRGYGKVIDSIVSYNINENLKNLTQEMITSPLNVKENFDNYLNEWSGYNQYIKKIANDKNLTHTVEMSNLDRKIWILEKFMGMNELTQRVESNYELNVKENQTVVSSIEQGDFILQDEYINTQYNTLKGRYEGVFVINSVYKKEFKDVTYDIDTDTLTVNDEISLQTNLNNYLNDENTTIEEKTYLAKLIHTQTSINALHVNTQELIENLEESLTKQALTQVLQQGEDNSIGSDSNDKMFVKGNHLKVNIFTCK